MCAHCPSGCQHDTVVKTKQNNKKTQLLLSLGVYSINIHYIYYSLAEP